uniref:DM2 domain-containing protein n=1 Tax=Noccaea caerulescens TaxID=107243 RepID=A0A1J3DRE0_NOCCA
MDRIQPSELDLSDHVSLLCEAMKRDEGLTISKIVERLHWYVQNGDTVVDFCSNDFSLMKEKLTKTGKSCFFKNFDLIPPKNDFNFEERDWLTVNKEELPDGSQLIMGLNPPFGYKSSLANIFIRMALEFKPKILILIVPSETKR